MDRLKRLAAILAVILAAVLSVAALVSGCGDDDSYTGSPVEEYTKYLVREAIDRYDAEGREATFAYYQSPKSVNGSWYVFILEDGISVVNANRPDIVGTSTAERVDVNGKPYGRELAAATEDGVWVDYYWVNPVTGQTQTKHSWVVVHDDLIFGSGWYEPGPSRDVPDTYTQAFVQRGIELYKAAGLGPVLDYYNSEQSLDGAWYLFVFDENDVLRTHAATPALVDLPARQVTGPDLYPTGLQVVADATPEGAWTSYSWVNPATGETQTKHSWVVRHDGLVFGSGWYEPGPSKDDPAGYAQALVQRAVSLHASLGNPGLLQHAGKRGRSLVRLRHGRPGRCALYRCERQPSRPGRYDPRAH